MEFYRQLAFEDVEHGHQEVNVPKDTLPVFLLVVDQPIKDRENLIEHFQGSRVYEVFLVLRSKFPYSWAINLLPGGVFFKEEVSFSPHEDIEHY